MRAVCSGGISSSLVNIPVKLYSGSERDSLDLDMVRLNDLCPVMYASVWMVDGKEIPYGEDEEFYANQYFDDRKGQTLAAPYCVRPKPGAQLPLP